MKYIINKITFLAKKKKIFILSYSIDISNSFVIIENIHCNN